MRVAPPAGAESFENTRARPGGRSNFRMKSFAWIRARRKALAGASVVTASAVVITTLAFVYEGLPTTEVDLHDGGVWITKSSSLLVGHFNHESRVLDGGLRTTSDDYDILQSGTTVLVVDAAGSTLSTVDPARVVLDEGSELPAGGGVALGGETVAVVDPASGALWAMPADAVGGFQPQGVEPLVELGEGARAVVGVDGVVHAFSPRDGEIVSIAPAEGGEMAEPVRHAVEGLEAASTAASITAVGDRAYVLDPETGLLSGSDGTRVDVEDADAAVLQQPSAASDAVTLSTVSHLVQVPTDGSEPVRRSSGAQGTPAAPVFLGGCTYAAWSGSARFIRDCPGELDDLETGIEGADETSVLQFRVNRDVVVLNDVVGGAAWMASDSMQRVDNWNDVTPPESESEEEDEQTTEETVETTLPERTEQNTPPIAVDDDFGVRPGRTTVLPVLDNDSDADGDVLVASPIDGGPSMGVIQQIHNGGALQIAVPEGATGLETFRYGAEDGRGGEAEAAVTLTVHDWDVNAAPVQKRVTAVTVESGGVVSYNVLPDWIDPDGDDVFLKQVTPAPGDEADFTSDGQITYRAIGGVQGRVDVPIVVSDGTEDAAGVLRLDVRPLGSTTPVTNADHVVVRAGQTVTVAPLTNDTSSGREPLRLTRVDEVEGATIVPDFADRTFSFTSAQPGTSYVQYLVSAGANSVPGLVRVDVLADGDIEVPPVAVRDVALLPRGGEVLVNVLSNDTDPAGGILVVQSVTVDPGTGVSVAVLGHETLRISDQSALDRQVSVRYRISNGTQTAEGEVVVIPVPAPPTLRPPVANDDQVVVRAGDIVTIPVLENDYHPNGDEIHVAPDLVAPLPDAADGEIFVSEDTLRFRASNEPGTVYATYEAVDSTGQRDAGYVTIQVLPVNAETNAAPRPRDIEARTLSGSEVRIAVPLDGIDEDGDSVELVGLASAPGKGRIVETGANFFVYEAFEDSVGVDTFTYRVRDRLGKEGTAPVRVGIAPPESANQAPYALKDAVIMRPDRQVAVPVLQNDSDPDGDEISLVRGGLVLPDVPGLDAEVSNGRVVVTAPPSPVETSLQYTIEDARGARAMAVLQITVAEDVPLQRPIARDDRVRAEDVTDEGTVDVEVLGNDEDPDGTVADLEVSVADGAQVRADGTVRVVLGESAQLLTYTITDRDGQSASAFIHVPALSALVPSLSSSSGVEVRSGETIQIPLAEHVRAAGGRAVVITEAGKVTAAHHDGASLVQDQSTLVYTSRQGYFGQDAIVFEVTDGRGPDDPEGRKATLTLPVTVLPPANQQPAFAGAQMDVAPGEDPASLDLSALVTDPDPGDLDGMGYTLVGGAPNGFTASMDGSALNVAADSDVQKGTTIDLRVRVDDGTTEPVEGTVQVRVSASTRPVPTANDDVITEADQGESITVPVLDNDFNPFPETPLVVVAASAETGVGVAEVAGDQVRVTPGDSFVGTLVVRYRVQDATADADREVEGRIRITVQGRPGTPGTPTVSSVQDRTVVLAWTPPTDNGAPITGYTVAATSGGYTTECASTTCTLGGLTNNVEYNFVVTATNRVGESDPSPASQTARPDARPDTPQPPTLDFGDRSLQVAWTTPPTPGSPVESFSLEISPAPPSGAAQKTDVSGTSLTWEGLENGVNYQVRVRAHNRAPEPSTWSAWSAGMVPARAPEAPAAPTTERLEPVGSQAQMRVSWTPPANNGDQISGYRLTVQGGGGSRTIGVPAGQTSQALALDASTSDYTFTVAAENKAGWGATSAPSAPRRAFVAPDAPTNVRATEGDNRVSVTYGAADGNGANAGELRYEYSVNNGPWRADWDGTTITSGVGNGGSYSVRVRAYTALDGVRYDGAASAASNTVQPYGPVRQPGVSANANGTNITYRWTAPAENGRAITRMEIRIDGGGWQQVSLNDATTRGYGHAETHRIEVRATDAAGQTNTNSAQARTSDPPQPRAWASRGSAVNNGNCNTASCAQVRLNVENFPAGNYRIWCSADGDARWGGGYTINIPANGSVEPGCYYGWPGARVYVEIVGWGDSERVTW